MPSVPLVPSSSVSIASPPASSSRCIRHCARRSKSSSRREGWRFGGSYGGSETSMNFAGSASSLSRTAACSVVCSAAIWTRYCLPAFERQIKSSQAGCRGSTATGASFSSSSSAAFFFAAFPPRFVVDLTTRGGCDEHRPSSWMVPMMKTVSRSYPAHCRPLSRHFLQYGR